MSIFLLYRSFSIAQTRDSSWHLATGINFSREFYNLYSYDIYQLTNKPSYSEFANVRLTKYVGNKKKLGFFLDPMLGVSQITFNAIIPNTDFNNPADSVSIKNSYNYPDKDKYDFFRNGKLLPKEMFTYNYDYWIIGAKTGISFKWTKCLETSIHAGFVRYSFYKKNYPTFRLASVNYYHTGSTTSYLNIINFCEEKHVRIYAGTDVYIHLNKRICLNASASMRFYNENFVIFLFDGGGLPKRVHYLSVALGFNYKLIR